MNIKPGIAFTFHFWTGNHWELDVGFTTTGWKMQWNRGQFGLMVCFGPLWFSTFDYRSLIMPETTQSVDDWLN